MLILEKFSEKILEAIYGKSSRRNIAKLTKRSSWQSSFILEFLADLGILGVLRNHLCVVELLVELIE